MVEQFLTIFIKYLLFYFYFYLLGNSFVSTISRFKGLNFYDKKIMYLNVHYLFPLIGFAALSNFLFLANTFTKLDSALVNLFILGFTIPGIAKILKNLNFSNIPVLSRKIFYYIVIPAVLLISTFDINFNYDAGYYHLLHQSWLRESNLIVGMTNIFWAFGMSSIYEYISSILWFDTTFVLLHFINIFFIHFFYIFISENLLNRDKNLFSPSIFILIFSFLDNFGFGGGRNGYIYIQGISKQDVSLGILFFYLSLVLIFKIKTGIVNRFEVVLISILSLFAFQIKVSGFLIIVLYAVFLIVQIYKKLLSVKEIMILNIPAVLLGILWTVKSIFTTGCLIFPVSFTCFNIFDWYQEGSTKVYESITKESSLSYNFETPFMQWVVDTGSFEYRNQIILNFFGSLVIIFLIKKLFFNKISVSREVLIISVSFLVLNFIYLLFYGPIPRYSIGLMLTTVGILGLSVSRPKFEIPKFSIYFLIFLSVFLLVRADSYTAFLNNNSFRFFDPRSNVEIKEIGFQEKNEEWVSPLDQDQCWTNTDCTPNKGNINLYKDNFFYVAYLE